MNKPSLWLTIGIATLLAAATGYLLGTISRNADATSAVPATNTIPNLILPDLKGQQQALAQWKGKILVLNYWATWCPPCRDEMPGFSRLQDKLGAKGVQFVGISIDQADKVMDFQKETPVSYPLLIGEFGAMQTSIDLGNDRQAMPFTAIFDRNGTLHSFKLGRFAEADLEKALNRLLEQ